MNERVRNMLMVMVDIKWGLYVKLIMCYAMYMKCCKQSAFKEEQIKMIILEPIQQKKTLKPIKITKKYKWSP